MKRVTILSALIFTLGILLGVSSMSPLPQSNNNIEPFASSASFFSEGNYGSALVLEVPCAAASMPQVNNTPMRPCSSSHRMAEAVRRSPLQVLHRTSPTSVRSVQTPLSDSSSAVEYYIIALRRIII